MQWNLFKPISSLPSHSEPESTTTVKNLGTHAGHGKLYHLWHQVEDNYLKHSPSDDNVVRPCFYTLTPAETNTQDAPKLDGLVSLILHSYLSFLFFFFHQLRAVSHNRTPDLDVTAFSVQG